MSEGVLFMKNKRKITGLLCIIMMLSVFSIGSLRVEAANKSKYFISQDICFKVISKDKVAACGIKLKVDKELVHHRWKSDTLEIPSYVTYKGTKYKVTQIADHDYYAHHGPIEWDSEDSINGKEVGINLPKYRRYSYFDLPTDLDNNLYGFQDAENIKKIILPNTLIYIGKGAFCGMPKLENVVFAKKYKKLTIGMNAFSSTKLKSITFPEGTYELKQCAAGSIPTIYIPSTVKKIGAEVVNADTKKVTISKKNKNFKMKDGMLYSYNEKKLLGASANVKKVVTISKKTKSIARNTFARTNVKQVNLNNKIKTISKAAFAYCSKLEKVTGTNEVSKIEYAAFAGCSKLKTIGKVPKLKSIARAVFWQNKKLQVNLSSTIKDIDTYAFAGTEDRGGVKATVAKGNPVIFMMDGLLIKRDGDDQIVLLQVKKKEKDGNLVIPEGVTQIPVAVSCLDADGIIFPTTLKVHDAKITTDFCNITYQTKVPPDFGRNYRLAYQVTLYVPKGVVEIYKNAISKVYIERGDGKVWKDEGGTASIKELP